MKYEDELELIALRQKNKGDTWILVGEDIERLSLTDALEAWFQKTGRNTQFRLDPLESKIWVINRVEKEEEIYIPKTYNIYGDEQ